MRTANPETLTDLLRALERSGELRTLARECGLSVRELRRRLAIWRRELQADVADGVQDGGAPPSRKRARGDGPADAAAGGSGTREATTGRRRQWPVLTAAHDLKDSPLSSRGRQVLEVFTDGASRGNPGPASIGVVFRRKGGKDLAQHSEAIGRATNNVAEYRAVVTALEHCRRWGIKRVHLKMDSELITRQLHGTYRVKSPDLRPLYQQVVFLSKDLVEFKVQHIKRALNGHADALANQALDA